MKVFFEACRRVGVYRRTLLAGGCDRRRKPILKRKDTHGLATTQPGGPTEIEGRPAAKHLSEFMPGQPDGRGHPADRWSPDLAITVGPKCISRL